MKVLHVGFQDQGGGAAESMVRVHKGLLKLKINSKILVARKLTNDPNVIGPKNLFSYYYAALRRDILRIPFSIISKELRDNYFSFNIFPSLIKWDFILSFKPDIINLHWINSEAVAYYDLKKINTAVVWTLHDLWPISGIFHLQNKSKSKFVKHLDTFFLKQKASIIKNFAYIAPSKMVMNSAYQSNSLNKDLIFNIPNSFDDETFKVSKCKRENNVVFIANAFSKDKNKGFDLLLKSLEILSKKLKDFRLITVGDKIPKPEVNFPIKQFGKIYNKKKMSNILGKAKVCVIPSRFENYPLVALEALACGTPVVSFKVGGMQEIIKNAYNGMLIKPFDLEDFGANVGFFLKNHNGKIIENCQSSVSGKTIESISKKYLEVYRLLNG